MKRLPPKLGIVLIVAASACTDTVAPDAEQRSAWPSYSASAATQVSAGVGHTCTVRASGVLECWGDNSHGQAPASRSATVGTYTQVSAGAAHTCALRTDAVIDCWGITGSGINNNFQVSSQAAAFTQVSAGTNFMCALNSAGSVECRGNNTYQQAPLLKSSANGQPFTQVNAAHSYACALRADGAIECWGAVDSFQEEFTATTGTFTQVSASLPTCGLRSDGAVECWSYFPEGLRIVKHAATGSFTQVSGSPVRTCALRTDGAVECWAVNGDTYEFDALPTKRPSIPSFVQLTVGGNLSAHVCALHSAELVQCWGNNQYGQAQSEVAAAPASVASVAAGPNVELDWTAGANPVTTHFRVARRSRNSDGTWTPLQLLGTQSVAVTSYTDVHATTGFTYQYRVSACNQVGCASRSSTPIQIGGLPVPPTAFVGNVIAATRVDLSWTDASANEIGFQIQRRIRDTNNVWSAWLLIGVPAANATSFSDLSATSDRLHQYRIQSCSAAGCSAWVASTKVRTP